MLNIKIESIKIKEEVNIEQLSVDEKGGRLDLQAKLNDGIIVNIELQMKNNYDIEERTTLYSSKISSREAGRGTDYKNIDKIIMINILGYNLLEFEEYISETVIVLDKHRDYEMLKGIKWYFIELPKFRKKNPDLNNKMDQWMCFIDDSNKGAVKMAENNNEVLKKARKELKYLTEDEAVRRLAELRDKWEMDDFFIKKRAEEKKQKEIAKNLLKMGIDTSKVIEATGLKKEEIEKLLNEIKEN